MEIRLVDHLVEDGKSALALRRQAQVHRHARPARPPTRGRPGTPRPCPRRSAPSTRTDYDLHLGRQAHDDARTGRAVAEQVDRLVGHDRGFVVDDLDGDALRPGGRATTGWLPSTPLSMIATLHARAGGAAPRPLAIDAGARRRRARGAPGPRARKARTRREASGRSRRSIVASPRRSGGRALRCAATTSRMSVTRLSSRSDRSRSLATGRRAARTGLLVRVELAVLTWQTIDSASRLGRSRRRRARQHRAQQLLAVALHARGADGGRGLAREYRRAAPCRVTRRWARCACPAPGARPGCSPRR